MALKTFRPLTPANRFKALPSFEEITKSKPEKIAASRSRRRSGGRNNNGRITCRHIGGGHKQKYRIIDFKRNKREHRGRGRSAIEYDPNRTCRIALLEYTDGEKTYILAPVGLDGRRQGHRRREVAEPKVGNALPLKAIPLGTAIHNVELVAGRGGQIARSAGQQVMLNNREGGYALVKLPSGEIRKIHVKCYATIGQVGNAEHMNVSSGKAGRTRWRGIRPTVRGMVMNPVDHPMGGGQGKSKGGGGRHHPDVARGASSPRVSRPAASTRPSNNFIVERRKSKKKPLINTPMGRSLKKGPFVDGHLFDKIDKMNDGQREEADQDLVAPLDDHAGLRRPHVPGPQRQDFQLRLRDGKHGRA